MLHAVESDNKQENVRKEPNPTKEVDHMSEPFDPDDGIDGTVKVKVIIFTITFFVPSVNIFVYTV